MQTAVLFSVSCVCDAFCLLSLFSAFTPSLSLYIYLDSHS